MNFAKVLSDLGAEDREIEHLLACDKCSVWNGYDGAELERCPDNPITVESRWLSDLRDIGWGLMAAFDVRKPPPGAFERLMQSFFEDYRRDLVAQLEAPFFLQPRPILTPAAIEAMKADQGSFFRALDPQK